MKASLPESSMLTQLLYLMLAPLFALATLGEICDTLREVFGEYEAPALV